jgi:hypothetical protein
MTEEEKQRLNELLLDIEQFDTNLKSNKRILNTINEQSQIEDESNSGVNNLVEYNPFLVSLAQGDGFTPDKTDLERLKEIDSRLEKRISRLNSGATTLTVNPSLNGDISRMEGFSSSLNKLSSSKHSTVQHNVDADSYYGLLQAETKQIKLNDDFDENEFGDKFIREARLTREQEIRLKHIDMQLEKLKNGGTSNGTSTAVNNGFSGSSYDLQSDTTTTTNNNIIVAKLDEEKIKLLIEEYAQENKF